MLIATVALLALAADHDQAVVTPDAIRWVNGPASLPTGARVAVLEGDPSKEGPFVLRVRLPDGARILPHTHPRDERVTVLRGTLYLGVGERFDPKAAREMPAGSYGRTTAGVKHFGYVRGETVFQLHCHGPRAIHSVKPADGPPEKK